MTVSRKSVELIYIPVRKSWSVALLLYRSHWPGSSNTKIYISKACLQIMCNPEPLKKQPKLESNLAVSSWNTGVALKWDFNCIPHSKWINSRNTWVNLVKKSHARGYGAGWLSFVWRENTNVPRGSISVKECDLLNMKGHRLSGAAKLFGPCGACRGFGPLGELLDLRPEAKPLLRVSGDWSVREIEFWGMEGRQQMNGRWLGSCEVWIVGIMEWHAWLRWRLWVWNF